MIRILKAVAFYFPYGTLKLLARSHPSHVYLSVLVIVNHFLDVSQSRYFSLKDVVNEIGVGCLRTHQLAWVAILISSYDREVSRFHTLTESLPSAAVPNIKRRRQKKKV